MGQFDSTIALSIFAQGTWVLLHHENMTWRRGCLVQGNSKKWSPVQTVPIITNRLEMGIGRVMVMRPFIH